MSKDDQREKDSKADGKKEAKKDGKKRKEHKRKRGMDYFEAFEEMADLAVQGADLLADITANFTSVLDMRPRMEDAQQLESASDAWVEKILVTVDEDFVTPIEREDLVELALALDEVNDELEKVIRHLYMYDVDSIEPLARQMCELIREECLTLQDAMRFFREFRKPKKLKARAVKIGELEDKVDVLYLRGIRKLFVEETDPVRIIKWRAMYSAIEECADNIDHAADIMTRIVVKNG